MSKSRTLGRESFPSRSSIASSSRSCLAWRHFIPAVCWALFLLASLPRASAQSVDTTALDAYAAAIKHSVVADRISALQQFISSAGNSTLKTDALGFLVWEYMRMGNRPQSMNHARELLNIDPGNALALAVLSQGDTGQSPNRSQLDLAKKGLNEISRLRRPEGMGQGEFSLLQKEVDGMLNGAAGLGYLAQKDYRNAKAPLQHAVAVDPNNGRYVYGLALALLLGDSPDTSDGYWYLARAVNLNSGTPAGEQISEFARRKYQDEGGSNANWNQFLAATAAGTANHSLTTTSYTTASLDNSHSSAAKAARIHSAKSSKSAKAVSKKPGSTRSQSTEVAEDSAPEIASTPSQPRPVRRTVSPTAPVSLGILVQTGLLTGGNRHDILNALTDLVRHLRQNDEVFIMAYSDQLDFEQDLTAQDTLLEEAISNLKPKSGAALFDGIAFAAGHLKRIGKNRNHVLLVISDGRNTATEAASTPLSAQLSEVTVNCIGLDVEGSSERDLLERLASFSGGHASFASDGQQFRAATFQMAESMGIEFPY